MTNRNDPCPCGSGKKYKKCCMGKGTSVGTSAPTVSDDELLRQAERLRIEGNIQRAAVVFEELLTRTPRHAEALFGLGQVHVQVQDWTTAIACFRRAIAARPRWSTVNVALADALLSEGHAEESLAAARAAIEIDAAARRAHIVAASSLNRLNRVDEAIATLDEAPAEPDDEPEYVLVRAELHRRRGELAQARTLLEDVIRREGLRRPMYHVWTELGLVLDKLGEYDEAFEATRRGGLGYAETRRVINIDRDMWFRRIDQYREVLETDVLSRWTAADFDDEHPVPAFLVGFPRSGTTMTEQIMAAHPDVATSDERPYVQDLCREVRRVTGSDDAGTGLTRLDRDDIAALRRLYWSRVAERTGDLDRSIFVDKLPLNIIDLGVINAIFPEARVIVALRDPRDVCLSCFMQRFGLNAAMVNFLWWERTAAFYAKVMGFWLWLRDVLTLPWITVRYEDTVVDLEASARRILEMLDLPWDDAVLSFHERAKKRALTTPSFVAVTEKVHTKAVGRWHNYLRHYDPVMDDLRPFLEAFGYEESAGA